jgi:hypothetical protein
MDLERRQRKKFFPNFIAPLKVSLGLNSNDARVGHYETAVIFEIVRENDGSSAVRREGPRHASR